MSAAVLSIAELRADAARRNLVIDSTSSLTIQQLHVRWNVSETTVRDIPRDDLPYMAFGRGLKNRRRRYRLADVEAYEARLLAAGSARP